MSGFLFIAYLFFEKKIIFLFSSAAGSNIYGLWILAGDLGYVIVFPQFFMAVHWPEYVNTDGSIGAAIIGIGSVLNCCSNILISLHKITVHQF